MNIGCDIVKNERLKRKSQRFIDLVLTKNEQLEYQKFGFSYLCVHFALKESIMKALPNTKELTFLDIEILTNENNLLYVSNIKNIHLSFSYEDEYTIATVILLN